MCTLGSWDNVHQHLAWTPARSSSPLLLGSCCHAGAPDMTVKYDISRFLTRDLYLNMIFVYLLNMQP